MKKFIDRIWEYIRANPKKFFFRVAFALFILWIFFDDYGVMKRIRMEAEHRALLEQHKVEQQKILENEQRIQHASPDVTGNTCSTINAEYGNRQHKMPCPVKQKTQRPVTFSTNLVKA